MCTLKLAFKIYLSYSGYTGAFLKKTAAQCSKLPKFSSGKELKEDVSCSDMGQANSLALLGQLLKSLSSLTGVITTSQRVISTRYLPFSQLRTFSGRVCGLI